MDELGAMIGHDVTYHGLWDHAKLGLNYSEVAMENEDPVHVFGLTSPDGVESHFSYLGNSTGQHIFKMGMGAPTQPVESNTVIEGRTTVTEGGQVRFFTVSILRSAHRFFRLSHLEHRGLYICGCR